MTEPAVPAPDGADLPSPLDVLFIGAATDGHVTPPIGDLEPVEGAPA